MLIENQLAAEQDSPLVIRPRASLVPASLAKRIFDAMMIKKRSILGSVAILALAKVVFGIPYGFNNATSSSNKIDRESGAAASQGPSRSIFCSSNPQEDMTTIELIKSFGYPAEEHYVKTEDGYVLALHRIPGKKGSAPILLHHALLESSFVWIINGKEKGLAFNLADHGYDVWMANSRGNTYSKHHENLSKSDSEFWDFSWHEMGIYDVPAEIDYISVLTKDRLLYIGHSMGTTQFFVMASQKPETAAKVKAMFALAPVAYTHHIKGSFGILGSMLTNIEEFLNIDGRREFLPQSPWLHFGGSCVCNKPILRTICENLIMSTIGFNAQQFNASMLPLILSHTPAGTSLKTLMHYAQGISSKDFRMYDYGKEKNLAKYNDEKPPAYDISKIQVPTAFFWGKNDFLAIPEDVKRLYDQLPNKIASVEVDHPRFNHLDFLWGRDAPKLVFSRLFPLIAKYR
ncbi:hypothetical protein TKK_0018124 [Trichogramma kaykai]|uniref:Partial AB-hydrolase lipase domain-containing protein n=1 Tax=Trichogramma kaykai TaxID=54128 RepID=A0ABD2VZY8_9HYME